MLYDIAELLYPPVPSLKGFETNISIIHSFNTSTETIHSKNAQKQTLTIHSFVTVIKTQNPQV